MVADSSENRLSEIVFGTGRGGNVSDAPGIESECYLIHSKQHSEGRPTSDPADFLLNMT